MVGSEVKYGNLMCPVKLIDMVCRVWSWLVLVVSRPSVATTPPVMPNHPRLRLYDLLGCSIGDWCCVLYCVTLLFADIRPARQVGEADSAEADGGGRRP